jgi:siroheme synthase-like protein
MGMLPKLFVDLAVPRDIDPAIADGCGAVVLNVDDLRGEAGGSGDGGAARERLARAEDIIRAEADRFELWRRNRRRFAAPNADAPDFPIFINLHQAPVLIAGGGKVAARRAEKLLAAGALVHVVSPAVGPEMEKLLEHPGLRWAREEYDSRHMDGVTLAIAATNRREVNARAGADARARGILVSVADDSRECTFYFPAIVKSDFLSAGLVSNNGDHAMVKRAAARLREEMERIDADSQGGEPRE